MKVLQEFKEFAIKGNVIDMAVGIIIGAAFGKIVNSLVADVIMPPMGYLIGRVNFADLQYQIQEPLLDESGTLLQPEIVMNYGTFIQGCLDFLIVALTLFAVIKLFNVLRRKAEDEKEPSVPTPKDIELLANISNTLVQIDEKLPVNGGR